MNHENNKTTYITLTARLCFYHEEPEPNTWGSNDIAYEIYYHTDTRTMRVFEIGAFGDATLIKSFGYFDLDKAQELIKDMSTMTLNEFKKEVLKC